MYRCLTKKSCADESGYQLIPIRVEDLELIRLWRNAQMDVLRQQAFISQAEQDHYFKTQIAPSFEQEQPKQILFSFLLNNICIGYGGLVHINWQARRAEVSFLVDPVRAADFLCLQTDFFHFLQLLCQIAFTDLTFNRLCTETFVFREDHIEIMEKIGFQKEGILREHVYKKGRFYDSILHGLLRKDTIWHSDESLLKISDESSQYFGVLVTSISAKVPLIQAVRRAINKTKLFNAVHGCDCDSMCIGQYAVDVFWNCPPQDEMDIQSVLTYCTKHRIKAIIPTRDQELLFYAKYSDLLKEQGISVMGSSSLALEQCQDKFLFSQRLRSLQFPAIPTYLSLNEMDSKKGSRYIVKEQFGSGSKKIGVNVTENEAIQLGIELKNPIFQPYIEGDEWSIDVYRSSQGKLMGCIARQRNLVIRGESQVTTTNTYPALEKLCGTLVEILDIQGHAVFQVIVDSDNAFHVIECNLRFGGASTVSLVQGLDSFYWFLLESMGQGIEEIPLLYREESLRQVRHSADWILPWS